MIVTGLIICTLLSLAQDSAMLKNLNIESVIDSLHTQYGRGKILMKDRSILKNVIILEVHPYWIVYKKGGSLHDLLIEDIQRIEIGKEKERVIIFDKNNKAIIY